MMLHPGWLSLSSLKLTESCITSEDLEELMTPYHDNQTSESRDTSDSSISMCKFHTLDLSWCDDLSSHAFAHLFSHCPALTSLVLRANNIDSSALMVISQSCLLLQELIIPRCREVDDAALIALSQSLSSTLTSLDVSWTAVRDIGTISLLETCTQLEILILEGCKELTVSMISCIESGRAPRLRLIDLGWVNMCDKCVAQELSRSRSGLLVSDYYQEVYCDGMVVED